MSSKITAELREEVGKGAARRARRQGRIPAVLYGRGFPTRHLLVEAREFAAFLHRGGRGVVELEVAGETVRSLVKEISRDPIKDTLLHVDFLAVEEDRPVEVEVPVVLVGQAAGVREGGVLEHYVDTITVSCLPRDVPSALEVDVSGLGLGDHITAGEIRLPSGVRLLTPPGEVIAAVTETAAHREAAAEAAAGEGAPSES